MFFMNTETGTGGTQTCPRERHPNGQLCGKDDLSIL